MTITIFHNPACSTSRKVLHMQLSPRESLRIHEPAYTDLRLDGDLLSNAHR
jgi:arsenate reductase-like glutaredoxin family protein